MTTILIDPVNKVVYSDTRTTTVKYKLFKEVNEYNICKAKSYKSNCGKFIVSGSGNCRMIHKYMLKLGITTEFNDCGYGIGDDCTISIINKYNGQVMTLKRKHTITGTKEKVKYYSNFKNLSHGSGAEYVSSIIKSVDNFSKVIHCVAMKDKHTNDVVNICKL